MKVGQQVFAQRQNPAAAQSPSPSNPPRNYAHDDIVAQPRPETSTLVKVGQVAALVSLMVGGAAAGVYAGNYTGTAAAVAGGVAGALTGAAGLGACTLLHDFNHMNSGSDLTPKAAAVGAVLGGAVGAFASGNHTAGLVMAVGAAVSAPLIAATVAISSN